MCGVRRQVAGGLRRSSRRATCRNSEKVRLKQWIKRSSSGGCYDGAFSEVLSLNHSAVPLDPPATHQSKLAPSVADQATKEQK